MNKCIFCSIISGEIPANIIYQDELCLAFPDIHPKAPTHLLVIPRKHISSLDVITASDQKIISNMLFAAQKLAQDFEVNEKGYRLVINTKGDGGQEVDHLHLHLLGGRKMKSMG